MDDPIVSILLVTWKRIDLLEDCLKAITAAKPAIPFELVIVNNGGSRTADRVEAIASGARIIHARVNLGLPGGLRLARSVARGFRKDRYPRRRASAHSQRQRGTAFWLGLKTMVHLVI